MEGHGVQFWPDGRMYSGQFVGDHKDGHGVFNWPDGREYDGAWKAGKTHGPGTYKNKEGEKKKGEWADGHRVRWIDDEANYEELSPEEIKI